MGHPFTKTLLSFLTPPILIGASAVVGASAVIFVFTSLKSHPQSSYATVIQGPIQQEVTATGTVVPVESVDLAFQRSGTIAYLPIDVGSRVGQGQALAELQSADLQAGLEQASSTLALREANLASLLSGTRTETLQSARAAVGQAMISGYIAADDAVHNRADQIFTNPRSSSPELNITASDQALAQQVINERVQTEAALAILQTQIPSGDVSAQADLTYRSGVILQELLAVQSFLDGVTSLLTKTISTTNAPTATIEAYQTSVAAGRTEVSAAIASLNTDKGVLSLDEAGATPQDIAAQKATVAGAQASVDAARAALSQTVITAPISGTITRQEDHVGQVVTPGQSFISLQSGGRLQVNAYVSDADVAKIKAGQPVSITLDAYPSVTFTASVVSIDPAATIQNGISSYKITVQFTQSDSRIKAGLTANLSINTGSVSQALLVPTSAIITNGTSTAVLRVGQNGMQTLIQVEIGIENSGGEAQILSGLSAGDRVASFGSGAQ